MEPFIRRLRNVCWYRLMLVALCAAFAFGGSFTCKSSTHDDDDDPPPTTTNPPAPAATR